MLGCDRADGKVPASAWLAREEGWTAGRACIMRPMPKSPHPTIEDHFLAVEHAVDALSSGELPLEEALTRYEAGLKAVRQARLQLDRYAARLEELRAEPAGGETTRDA